MGKTKNEVRLYNQQYYQKNKEKIKARRQNKPAKPSILQFINEYEKNFICKDLSDTKLIYMRTDGMLVSQFRDKMIVIFQDYIKSNEWRRLRLEVIKRANGKCVDCGEDIESRGIVHHEYYDDWGKGNYEEIMSCVYLCESCHTKRHHKMDPQLVPFFAKRINHEIDCYSSMANRDQMFSFNI